MENIEVELITEKKERLRNRRDVAITLRCRSHFYAEDYEYFEHKYIDTVHYDSENANLDVGYQRLKLFNPVRYPMLSEIISLFIDHNSLRELPTPEQMPCLKELTAHVNKISELHFYPKLKLLNIASNRLSNLKTYHNSNLQYLDVSQNKGIDLNLSLPNCIRLYASECELKDFNFDYFPQLRIVDISHNQLNQLKGKGSLLEEIHCHHNKLKELISYPKLVRLDASDNLIEQIGAQNELVSLYISHNLLKTLPNFSKLIKLIASYNCLETVGTMSELELIDLSHNKLIYYQVPNKALFVSLQFNRLTIDKLIIQTDTLKTIKELQIDMNLYSQFYDLYEKYFQAVNIMTDTDILKKSLDRVKIFSDSIKEYIMRRLGAMRFNERDTHLLQTAMSVYWNIFSKSKEQTEDIRYIEKVSRKPEFNKLLEQLYALYYKAASVCLFFNNYVVN
jgi:Leucine-rich repeat (LRR) protein